MQSERALQSASVTAKVRQTQGFSGVFPGNVRGKMEKPSTIGAEAAVVSHSSITKTGKYTGGIHLSAVMISPYFKLHCHPVGGRI